MTIPFNKPFLCGTESTYISQALKEGKMCGNGNFTHLCQNFFQEKLGAKKCLLTTSCTDALEMCAMLANVGAGDEVIVPSYTFVSSALAFSRQGATIIFADSSKENPCIDADSLEELITERTKAVVVVHYAGIACDMDKIMNTANKHNLIVIEDAAQSIDSYYNERPLGSIGHLAAFSFHETKNVQCGEGGMLAINDERFLKRAETVWEKGTNRAEFFRGEVNKYGWVDTGSSFLPAEYVAAFLWAQLQSLEAIQKRRKELHKIYENALQDIEGFSIPQKPTYASENAHAFFGVCATPELRTALIAHLKQAGISATFHYLSLHASDYARRCGWSGTKELVQADRYTECLLRLPLFGDLTDKEALKVCKEVKTFFSVSNQ